MSDKKLMFGPNDEPGSLDEMGGKGFHLGWMRKQGMPVPPACVISTALCKMFWRDEKKTAQILSSELIPAIEDALDEDGIFPLVSVRSGAKFSMPGMMDTILNVGLTQKTLPYWEKKIGVRAARDSRRRLLQMFGEVVYGIDSKLFEQELSKVKGKRGIKEDCDLDETDLSEVCRNYEKIFAKQGKSMPETASEQIRLAALAVLNSWNNPRAIEYRKMEKIPDDIGTAITVQRMVFGNLNENSCSGVMFTRDPSTGKNSIIGEFLPNAQGEDVVAGIRTPISLRDMDEWNNEVYCQLERLSKQLERAAGDMQDIEFTVEDGKLWLLQTRRAKRSALAAVKCALDMVDEGMIAKKDALERITLNQYETLSAPMIAPGYAVPPDVKGLPASVGIVTGEVYFSSEKAEENPGCILVAEETTPDDLPGMRSASGILTATGGVTSHAAVVARGMDKVCVVGAGGIKFKKNSNGDIKSIILGSHELEEGDVITLDGAGGRAWVGTGVPVVPGGELKELLTLHDAVAEVYPVYRVTTDGRDLHSDFKMVYATYNLDVMPEEELKNEIRESLPYLNGIVDLTTYSDLAPEEDRAILALMGSGGDDEVFEAKAKAVLGCPSEHKGNFLVHLGRREKDWKEKFERNGFKVIPTGNASTLDQESFVICQDEKTAKAALALAQDGKLKAVCAVNNASQELLESLSERSASEKLAMSSQQILTSVLKRK